MEITQVLTPGSVRDTRNFIFIMIYDSNKLGGNILRTVNR